MMQINHVQTAIKQLGELAHIAAGYPFRGTIPEVPCSQTMAVQMKDVSLVHGIDWTSCTRTELVGKRNTDGLLPGDILLAARGNHHYAIMVDEQVGLAELVVAAPHFFVVRCRTQSVLPAYLSWYLNQQACQRYLSQNAEGTLTKSIRRSAVEQAWIALPPLDKQHAIVGLAEQLRQERLLLTQQIRNGEQLMHAIARDLLPRT